MNRIARALFFVSKVLGVLVIGSFVFHSVATNIFANEGRIDLKNGAVACQGVSLWEGDRYRLVGRCQGLVYPYAERLDNYMLWVRPVSSSNPIRLREVEKGLFDAQTDQQFIGVIITAEEENNPRQPSTAVIVSGDIQPYDFRTAPAINAVQPDSVPDTVVVSPTPRPTKVQGITFGSNAVFNIVLIVILTIVVLWILFFMRR